MANYSAIGDAHKAGDTSSMVTKDNRYYRMAQGFEKDGYYRSGMSVYTPMDLWLAKMMMDTQIDNWIPTSGQRPDAASDDLCKAVEYIKANMTSTGSTTGDELVPTGLAATLWEDFFLASKLVSLAMPITPPTNPYNLPIGLGDPTWTKGTENTAATASTMATARSTMTATELMTEQNWSYTLDEDSIIAMIPAMRAGVIRSGAAKMDAFFLNADSTDAGTGNINLDDADPAATTYYLSDGQDGIRHQWLVDYDTQTVDAGGNALADTDVADMLVLLGKYGADLDRTVMTCDVSTYFKGLQSLDGVMTLDKFGPQAVLLTGEISKYRGIPVVLSGESPLTMADGKVSTTAGNNTLGQISCFHRDMWYVGFWRNLLIEMDKDIQKRMYLMVTSFRQGLAAHGTRASATHTAGIMNILV